MFSLLGVIILIAALVGACGGTAPEGVEEQVQDVAALEPVPLDSRKRLQVVATTNIVGDVVSQVGGDEIALTTLMETGVDPHSYVPTPAGTAAIHDGHVVFANGAGLEADLEEMFESAGGDAVQVYLSQELEHRASGEGPAEADHDHGPEEEGLDPHAWFDVQNVIHWAETIEQTLSALDPANAEAYRANAAAYVE
ncbi:MAG: metal ABC transporter substrate-binding protein, partial [Anaerolineae bacterium]